MTVKGQEFPAYDSRGIQGMGLAYATIQPRRLPPARLHGRLRGARHPGEDRSAGHRGQGRPGEGVPGRDRRVRLVRASACSRRSPGRWPTSSRSSQAACEGDFSLEELGARRRADLEHGARVQQPRRASRARTTTCRRACRPSRRRPGPRRGWSTASTRCCRSTTRCAAGTKDGVPTPATRARLEPDAEAAGVRTWDGGLGRAARPSVEAAMKHVIIGNGPAGVDRRRDAAQDARRRRRSRDRGRRARAAVLADGDPLPADGQIGEAGTYLRKDAGTLRRLGDPTAGRVARVGRPAAQRP